MGLRAYLILQAAHDYQPDDDSSVNVGKMHGTNMLLSSGEFDEAGKFFATATVTSADAAVDGTVTVTFTDDGYRHETTSERGGGGISQQDGSHGLGHAAP